MTVALLIEILIGVALVVGVVVVWVVTRNVDRSPQAREKKPYEDHSLDEWRRQRQAESEADRIARANEDRSGLHSGSGTEQQTTQRTHTRMGG